MDELYPRLTHAIFDPWLDSSQYGSLAEIMPINDPPGPVGSAYDGGWEGYLQRALLQALGRAPHPYAQSYCGNGALDACRAAVQAALQGTIDALTAKYGTADMSAWTCARSNAGGLCNPANDDVQFSAVGVGSVPGIPWINRPTFQQVIEYQARR